METLPQHHSSLELHGAPDLCKITHRSLCFLKHTKQHQVFSSLNDKKVKVYVQMIICIPKHKHVLLAYTTKKLNPDLRNVLFLCFCFVPGEHDVYI